MGNEIYAEDNLKSHPKEVLQRMERTLTLVKPYVQNTMIADFGADNGEFSTLLGKWGSVVDKYDYYPSSKFVSHIDLKAPFNLKRSQYAVIVLNHVLEHIEAEYMMHVVNAIKSSLFSDVGRVIVAVPDASITPNEYEPFDLGRGHVIQFTRETLTALFEKNGFDTIMCISHDPSPGFSEIVYIGRKR